MALPSGEATNSLVVGIARWANAASAVPEAALRQARLLALDSLGCAIAALDEELYADFETLRVERARTDDAIAAWVATLDEATLAKPLRYVRRGVEVEHPHWFAAIQVFNHQTHHRGQATTLLMQLGVDPGVRATALRLAVSRQPVRGLAQVRVSWPAAGTGRVDLYDVSGRLQRTLFAGDAHGSSTLDLPGDAMSPGVYLMRARQGSHETQQRVVILH